LTLATNSSTLGTPAEVPVIAQVFTSLFIVVLRTHPHLCVSTGTKPS
jgi:hypothetical protein